MKTMKRQNNKRKSVYEIDCFFLNLNFFGIKFFIQIFWIVYLLLQINEIKLFWRHPLKIFQHKSL